MMLLKVMFSLNSIVSSECFFKREILFIVVEGQDCEDALKTHSTPAIYTI